MKKSCLINNIPRWQWLNCKAKKHAFLAQGQSYFHFPFLENTLESWRYFGYAVRHVAKHESWFGVLAKTGLYLELLSLLAMTLEHLGKMVISLCVRNTLGGEEPSKLQPMMVCIQQRYLTHSASKPWYSFDFLQQRKELQEYANKQKDLSCKDKVLLYLLQAEYLALGALAVTANTFLDMPEANAESIPCYVTYTGKRTAEVIVCQRHLLSGYDCHKLFKEQPFLLKRYDDKELITCKVRFQDDTRVHMKAWYQYLIITNNLDKEGRKEGLVNFTLSDSKAQKDLYDMMQALPLGDIEAIF